MYRAGIIGLGMMGGADPVSAEAIGQSVRNLSGGTHLEAYIKNSRIELVAGSSRDAGRRKRFHRRTRAFTFANWREMLDKEPLDIVSVATYAPQHAEMVYACAELGIKAIYCEKPIATKLADAKHMIFRCHHAGSLLVINHNRRFHANYRRLKKFLEEGGLGKLTSASLMWKTGRLANVGTHMFDAICMLVGKEVKAVSGTLDLAGRPDCRGPQFRDPGGWGVMRMDNDFFVTVDAGDYSQVPHQIIINGELGRVITGMWDVKIEFWNGQEVFWRNPMGRTPMDQAVTEIVSWLDGGSPFTYQAEESVKALEVATAFHVSNANGTTWEKLPLIGMDRDLEILSA